MFNTPEGTLYKYSQKGITVMSPVASDSIYQAWVFMPVLRYGYTVCNFEAVGKFVFVHHWFLYKTYKLDFVIVKFPTCLLISICPCFDFCRFRGRGVVILHGGVGVFVL